jgi:hypothetical protein
MRNAVINGTKLALAGVTRRLPPGWAAKERPGIRDSIVLELRATDGRRARLDIIARKGLSPRDVPALVATAGKRALVVSPYLSGRTRELLAEAGVSYADATVSEPAVFLEGIGADQDPERSPRPLHSLRRAAAARVIRALCEFSPPFGVRALAQDSATPLGTVSRVVSFLETEALLTRDAQKQIINVDWATLLTRWSKDYSVSTSNLMRTHLEPRGLGALWAKLSRLPRYATTGSIAGASVAPTRLAMIYVDDADDAARTLDLVPTEAGANVWLLQPYDDVVFDRTRHKRVATGETETEIIAVSFPQTAVDLMTSPGRGPQEAEALISTMKETVDEWQSQPRP